MYVKLTHEEIGKQYDVRVVNVKIDISEKVVTEYGVRDFEHDDGTVVLFSNKNRITYENAEIDRVVDESDMDVKTLAESMSHALEHGEVKVTLGEIDLVDEAYNSLDEEHKEMIETR